MEDSDYSSDEVDEGSFELHDAADAGDAARVQQLLQERAEAMAAAQEEDGMEELMPPSDRLDPILHLRDQQECTALHLAVLRGHVDVVKVLLEANAPVTGENTHCDGCPLLHMAACAAALPAQRQAAADIFRLLLDAGADPFDRDDGGRSALHWCAELGLHDLLAPLTAAAKAAADKLAAAAASEQDPAQPGTPPPPPVPVLGEMQDKQGDTALHVAARFDQGQAAQALLDMPSSAEACKLRNKSGWLPIHLAAFHGSSAVAKLLLAFDQGLATAKDRKGDAPAVLARRRGHASLVDLLKGKGATAGNGATPAAAADAGGAQTLLVAPVECNLHHTCRQPMGRYMMPPPENPLRLQVLTAPGRGILHTQEFVPRLRWVTSVGPAPMADVLRVHDWNYIRRLQSECMSLPDNPAVIGHLDPDTALSHHSFQAALRAAAAVCQAVDAVVTDGARHAFCAVRPPGHHAGPRGKVPSRKDPVGSHGFCLLNNIAIAAAYAMNVHRHKGIQRVALLDFDVHHGNGTEACVAATAPRTLRFPYFTPLSEGVQVFHTWQPWLDVDDDDNIFFASVQGYGPKMFGADVYVYPGSGATHDTLHDKQQQVVKQEQEQQQKQQPGQQGSAPGAPSTANNGPTTSSSARPTAAGAGGFEAPEQGVKPVVGSGGDATVHPAPAAAAKVEGKGQAIPEDPDGEFKDDPDAGAVAEGPRMIDVGIGGPGFQVAKWRRAWRDKVLPALVNFNPDLILISAGFDAHRKDDINFKYIGATEADFEWLTDQIVQVANKCCPGRVVSALEGGYNINGNMVSAFARSVAAHVRALAEPHTQKWDALDSQIERELERKRQEERAAKAAARAAAAAERLRREVEELASEAGGDAAAAAAAAAGEEGAPRSKRRRTGAVDYVALNAQMEAEKKAAEGGG